jgi:hypothetical protein
VAQGYRASSVGWDLEPIAARCAGCSGPDALLQVDAGTAYTLLDLDPHWGDFD